jgi:hypothetical protein
MSVVQSEHQGVSYAVSASDLGAKEVPADFWAFAKSNMERQFKGKVVAEIPVMLDKTQGRAYTLETPQMVVKAVTYAAVAQQKAFHLLVIVPKSKPEPPEVGQFLSSFSILKPPKLPILPPRPGKAGARS